MKSVAESLFYGIPCYCADDLIEDRIEMMPMSFRSSVALKKRWLPSGSFVHTSGSPCSSCVLNLVEQASLNIKRRKHGIKGTQFRLNLVHGFPLLGRSVYLTSIETRGPTRTNSDTTVTATVTATQKSNRTNLFFRRYKVKWLWRSPS